MSRSRSAMAGALLMFLAAMPRPVLALDLAQALREVAAANPTLAARAAMVDAARRRVGPAGAWASPTVELGVVNVPTTGSFDTDPMTMKMVGVSQRLPVFGSNGLARRSARAAVTGEAAAAEQTAWQLYGEAWRAYGDAFYAGQLEALADEHRAIAVRMVQSARARYESGRGRLEDVLHSQGEQAAIAVDLVAFRAEAEGAYARLDALRGRSTGVADSLAPLPAASLSPTAAPWLATVTSAHPRLRESEARIERYRLAASAARRSAWPDLELRGSYGRRAALMGVMPQDDMFSASVGFALPIFNGSRELSQAGEMDALARASEAERRGAELDLRAEVTAAWVAALGAERRVALLADTVLVIHRRAAEASTSAYAAGSGDLWRTFEATHALYAQEIATVRARQELAAGEARLVALTGRTDLLGVPLPERRSER